MDGLIKVILSAVVAVVIYSLIAMGILAHAERQCRQRGIVIKVDAPIFDIFNTRCIYADDQGLVHEEGF